MKVKKVLQGLGIRPGPRPIPRGCLLTDPARRDDWRGWLAAALKAEPPEAVFTRHPRAAALARGFSIGAYLAANADVADAIDDPSEAVFHYLEFGLPEGRSASPDTWDPRFVACAHGLRLPDALTAEQAAVALHAHGVPHAHATLTERDLWLTLGLHGPVLVQIFNPDLYLALLDAAGHALPAPDRLSCIAHVARIGLDAGVPVHPDHGIDAAFYRASLAEVSLPIPAKAMLTRHWARIGLRAGAHANPAAWAMATHGLRLPDKVQALIPCHSAGTLAAFIAAPVTAARKLDARIPDTHRFLIDLARLKRHQGVADQAEALLRLALAAAPQDPRAAVDLADLIHGRADHTREIALRTIAPAGFDSGANRISLAELRLATGAIEAALDLATTLPPAARGDVALSRRTRALARAAFDALWNDLARHVETLGLAQVQSLLSRALTLYAPPPDLAPRYGPIRSVAILANDDLYQCKLYRADQKADQLRAQGIAVQVYLQSRDVGALHADLARFDAVIFQRNPAFPPIADVMLDAAQQGIATFYDIDDLIFDTAHFPPPLASYGGQITAAQHAAIACGVPLFAAAAALCGTGIASTEPIRAALAPLTRSGTAFVHRNALGTAHMAAMRAAAPRKSGKVVLFYGSGTKAHKADFTDILEPALARVLAARPGRVEVRLMGDFPDLTHLEATHPDVSLRAPVWDFESYAARLQGADIALSVLSPSPSADAKSELKWTEPAMFAIPCIASPTRAMADAIEDGATGLLAADTAAFTTALLRLIDDPALRARIGKAAQARVLRDYGLDPMGKSLLAQMASGPSRTHARRPAIKLLVVNVFYPPQDIGGATRVVADNVRHLSADHGIAVDVITTLEGGAHAHTVTADSRDGARIWRITAADRVNEQAMVDPVMDARIEALFDRIQPDIVHVHCLQRMGVGVIDLCRRRAIPYVLTLHDGWWASPHQFILGPDGTPDLYDFHPDADRPPRAEIARRCLLDAAALLAVSEPFAALHRSIGLPQTRAVPNGVAHLPAPARMPAPPGRVRLGHIGGAARHKGYDLLRAALTSRPFANLDLLIVDHALPPGTEGAERWNTTPVRRIPRLPQTDIAQLYGAFDVLVAPSIWPESHGLVAREALGLGLWVVASDQGAMGMDVHEDVTGHIVPVHDHRALAAVLARIDADPARYAAPHGAAPSLRRASDQAAELAALYAQILDRT